jgi:predicted NBD/HSP70 family sugar kinase
MLLVKTSYAKASTSAPHGGTPDRTQSGPCAVLDEIGHHMDSNRATVRDLRRRNRSAVLTRLYFDGPISRQELAERTGLSPATVSNVTAALAEEHLIVEAGQVDSDGGRPRVLLRVNPDFGHVVGIDVGETGVKVELFDLTMHPLATIDHPLKTARPDPDLVVEQLSSALREVIDSSGVDEEHILGVGVGLPGTVQRGPNSVVHAQVIGWEGVPFEDLLRGAGVGLPLFFDNGAKTQGQAELWFGAGRGARHAVVALIGSGVGAAVITNGSTYQGATSSAGEWGHTTIVYGGRECRCGSRGCLEAYVGAESVLDRYRIARRGRPVPGNDERSSLAALIAAAASPGTAATILEETAGYLGAGIANLINLFNPERIVLGGWAGIAIGNVMLPEIRAVAAAHALRHPMEQTTIEMCQLGPDAVAFGAATLPVAALLNRGGIPADTRRHRPTRRTAQPSTIDAA